MSIISRIGSLSTKHLLIASLSIFFTYFVVSCDGIPNLNGPQKTGGLVRSKEITWNNSTIRINLHKIVGGGYSVFFWCKNEGTVSFNLNSQIYRALQSKAAFTDTGWLLIGGDWISHFAKVDLNQILDHSLWPIDDNTYIVRGLKIGISSNRCETSHSLAPYQIFASEFESGKLVSIHKNEEWWLYEPLVNNYIQNTKDGNCLLINDRYVADKAYSYSLCTSDKGVTWTKVFTKR